MDNSQETPPNFIQTRLAVALAGALQSEWNAKEWHILHKFDELQSSVSSGTPSDRQDLLDRMVCVEFIETDEILTHRTGGFKILSDCYFPPFG